MLMLVTAMLLPLTAAMQATAQQDAEQQMVQVGVGRLHLVVHRGTGSSVVLLESGAGLGASEWDAVIASLAPRTDATIVAYDRAGMGTSDALSTPFDIHEEADRLHRALYTLGLDRKLVLAGHSFGGFLIQLYANLYPADVDGLVYVDANTIRGLGGVDGARKVQETYQAAMRERGTAGFDVRMMQDYVAATATMLRYPAPCGIPVTVLTQGRKPSVKLPDYLGGWRAGHEELAAATGGTLIVAQKSGHMIPTDEPVVVADAILATMRKPAAGKRSFPAPGARCG
jgi:pimeloyl-ACP methyl ester carboxylesterase